MPRSPYLYSDVTHACRFALQSVYIVASYNSTLVFPWVDTVFEHRDYIKNSANSSQMSRMEIAE